VRAIRRRFPEAATLGFDLNPPSSDPPDEFVKGSIVDADLCEILRRFDADTVVHLAYVVEPSRDLARMREVNVTGTERMLAAAVAARASRLVVSSSATVYGPWPEHAVPCQEDAPLRPHPRFTYAVHKGQVETMLAAFAAAHPEIAVAWTRPAIVCATGAKNFLSDIFLTVPFMALPCGRDTPLQFVHADDLADATLAILSAGGRGPYNVAPRDALTQRDLATMMGIRAVSLPMWLVTAAALFWWTLRLPWLRTPPGLTAYLSHPWLVDSSKLTADCGFSFRYSCREAFATLLPEADDPGHAA
jgi:nucleoside-diphosphate-sugar epimerase